MCRDKVGPFVSRVDSCCFVLDTCVQLWNVVMNQSMVFVCLRGIVLQIGFGKSDLKIEYLYKFYF